MNNAINTVTSYVKHSDQSYHPIAVIKFTIKMHQIEIYHSQLTTFVLFCEYLTLVKFSILRSHDLENALDIRGILFNSPRSLISPMLLRICRIHLIHY